ncbi:hypothetical protein AVEN_228615-1 [Araneus ventricosus]|uniref:Uncharacterized protein n=1 Tax=Araneus ventricosus TaxID=182803 RepID=A0A4Y2T816_ARAVE|nr:hypothetical protein AVEN_228615-1 [Araneus ventricosus]
MEGGVGQAILDDISRRHKLSYAIQIFEIEIATDDEEIDDACTRTDHGHVDFDENIQEDTDGTIEILKEKDAAE